MKVLQTPYFKKIVKKLHANQRSDLDKAVMLLIQEPDIGQKKLGDLAEVRVYKFMMNKQLTLLAYIYKEDEIILTLLNLGSHQNFYRDLKNNL